MAKDKSIANRFTNNQVKELTKHIIESCGYELPSNELNESIYLALENVPGVELISTRRIQLLTTQIRNQYYDEIKRKE